MKKVIKMLMSLMLICIVANPVFLVKADTKGVLVETKRINYDDGTYLIEKTYISSKVGRLRSRGVSTKTFTKSKDWKYMANGTVYLSATMSADFSWNPSASKVTASNVVGQITYLDGGKISNEKTSISGNNTRKVTATYSFTRKPTFSAAKTHSISISCDYKGVSE